MLPHTIIVVFAIVKASDELHNDDNDDDDLIIPYMDWFVEKINFWMQESKACMFEITLNDKLTTENISFSLSAVVLLLKLFGASGK